MARKSYQEEMHSLPTSVVVVGGSLAGLANGLQLKRLGSNVILLEQETSERSSHVAGNAVGPHMEDFLQKYDFTGLCASVAATSTQLAYRKYSKVLKPNASRRLTSWGLLYRILRANFDGLVLAACPDPPSARAGEGRVEYRAGKMVVNLDYADGLVTVHYIDVTTRKPGCVTADLVIAADGMHSTIRYLVQPSTTVEYSGYVAWRGAVSENDIRPETREYFTNNVTVDMLGHSYILTYVIPTDTGSCKPGERLLNWVWYCNVAEGSTDMTEIFTDVNGKYHRNTVSADLLRRSIWERHRDRFMSKMADPFTELVRKTARPFVTKINDTLSSQWSFHDGHVVLVGEALAGFRPHLAAATDHAAWQCLTMTKVWQGDLSKVDCENHILERSRRTWLASRLLGTFGQGLWLSFIKTAFIYITFIVWTKLRRF